ncbi:MAG: winged helix-turn-helix domain-containing protein [Desulfurococcaceae archaeon]
MLDISEITRIIKIINNRIYKIFWAKEIIVSKKTLTFKVLEILRDNPGLSLKELSSMLNISVARIREVVYRLKSSGYLEKTGRGYILTGRGIKLLEYISGEKTMEKSFEAGKEEIPSQPANQLEKAMEKEPGIPQSVETGTEQQRVCINTDEFNKLVDKVRTLEDRILKLEKSMEEMVKALEAFKRNRLKADHKHVFMELPVMSYNEALSKLGNILDRLIIEGKIVKIGSLVVDAEFYKEFRSKFPIRTAELDKLTHFEKILLEELRKEAMVVLHAGREYRFVESP